MTAPSDPGRILTVCLGNICRSPTAEAAIVTAAEEAGLSLEVASAGTGDWHLGEPPHPPMREAAAAGGLTLRGTAQRVDADLLAWADVVLVMDRSNLRDVTTLARAAGVDTPVLLFRTFDPEWALPDTAAPGAAPDVPDPYGGGPEDFEDVVHICTRTARAMVATWPDAVARAQSDRSSVGSEGR